MRVICDMNEDQPILVLTNTDLDDIGVGVSVCLCGWCALEWWWWEMVCVVGRS